MWSRCFEISAYPMLYIEVTISILINQRGLHTLDFTSDFTDAAWKQALRPISEHVIGE